MDSATLPGVNCQAKLNNWIRRALVTRNKDSFQTQISLKCACSSSRDWDTSQSLGKDEQSQI